MAIPAFAGMTIAQTKKGIESVGVGEASDNGTPTHLPTPTPFFYIEELVIPAKAGIASQTMKAIIFIKHFYTASEASGN